MTAPQRLCFGEFVLETPQHRVLRRDGTALALTPRQIDALRLFVEHPGELLDKETLLRTLWPGLVVEENNLSQVISALRRALGDDAQGSRFIQTVPRRGFRFIAAVSVPTGADAAAPPTAPAALGGAVATPGGGAAWIGWRDRTEAGALPTTTIAVLPFKPLVEEGRDKLLEVGMADSLIARLSNMPGLVVRSVGSVLRHAGLEQDPLRAARELDVAWIVDGSLQQRGGQLRVTARLLRAADGIAAWSGSFDEQFTGVFDVQDQISSRVAQALEPALSGTGSAGAPGGTAVEIGGTRSTRAYRLYLEAMAQMRDQRADGMRNSIDLFRQALDVDPGYALAWTGLADAHRRITFIGEVEPRLGFAELEAASRRALALAPQLGDAHANLAFKSIYFDFDWAAGEQELRRAISVNPNVAVAHLGLGQVLLTQGRIDEGLTHLRLARELDPMQPIFNAVEASFLRLAGRIDAARARLERAFEIAPGLPLAFLVKAQQHFDEHQPELGIAALRSAVVLSGGAVVFESLLGFYLARNGGADEARAIGERLRERARDRYVAPTALAAVHAGLGETAAALTALEEAYRVRDARVAFLKDAPYWASLRRQPRFVSLLAKMGLDRFGPGLWNP